MKNKYIKMFYKIKQYPEVDGAVKNGIAHLKLM